uniref:Uncharacterized protein n=2 Tax=Rhizochromulina marina TaxID=1034831 RepID=A0A7S2WW29_9STRA
MFPNSTRGKSLGSTVNQGQRGALIAAGEHKGYGLALFSEIFAAVASGGQTIAPHHEKPPAILNSMMVMVFDPVRTSGASSMEPVYDELSKLVEYVQGSPHRTQEDPLDEGVLYPGQRSQCTFDDRSEEGGFYLDMGTWSSLQEVGAEVGVSAEAFARCVEKVER